MRSSWRCKILSLRPISCSAFLLLLLCSCGGGSISTEGNVGPKNYILGRVVGENGSPVTGAEVTDLTGGESVSSDRHGNFKLFAERGQSKLQILVRAEGIESIVELDSATDGASIEVILEVNPHNATVEVASFQVVPADVSLKDEALLGEADSGQPPRVRRITVQGRFVLPDGFPIPGARISIGNAQTRTDRLGNFYLNVTSAASSLDMQVSYLGIGGRVSLGQLRLNRDLLVKLRLVWEVPSEEEALRGEDGYYTKLDLSANAEKEALR